MYFLFGPNYLQIIPSNGSKNYHKFVILFVNKKNQHLNNYEFAEFGQKLENFVWNDFCDSYLEIVKVAGSETNT
ncbi:MAG: class I tRNA ligase family protein, partial [Chitinophagaceae bacterium]|nr:class I tRNA ligase family protein [Chitinophagaceae bacterium]